MQKITIIIIICLVSHRLIGENIKQIPKELRIGKAGTVFVPAAKRQIRRRLFFHDAVHRSTSENLPENNTNDPQIDALPVIGLDEID